MTCAGSTITTGMFYSCNAVTGQGTEAQATSRWGNGSFIALQSFDARARVARQTGGFSSPDPADIWNAGNTLATSGTYLGNVGELGADAGLYVALQVPTLGAGASTSFRISYVLSADGNNAPVLGSPVVSGIGQTYATVASTVNPKGFSTTAELVYSTDPDFETSSTVSMGTLTGSDEVAIDAEITGLDPSEIYYAKIVATNETGETESAIFEFETLAATAPIVSSEEPTVTVDDGPVTLSGTLNPNGFNSTAVFQYSTTADFSGTVVDVPVSGTFTGTSLSTVSTVVEGLTGSTTYYFRLKVTNASGSAYGSTISFVPADIVAPVGIVVTSLEDTTANGTLRWAIAQANATAGGIYDAIIFDVDGTISLTSSLPSIVGTLTITGNGRTNTIIDGNTTYRPFYVGQGNSLTILNMTLKRGPNVDGGLVFNTRGTVSAMNVRFTGMSGGIAVFNKEGGTLATYTNCTFDNLSIGISADHGSTPFLATGITTWANELDSVFGNKTYVVNSVFENNTYGINSQRFTKIQNSTFTSNSYGAAIQGLNRSQVLNSTFSNNSIGVYHNAYMEVGKNYGTNNRLITGNTFNSNGVSIYLDDTWNNGQKNQSWSTVTGNTWDTSGVWVRYYLWNGSSNVGSTIDSDDVTSLFVHSANTVVTPPTTTTTTTTTTSTVPVAPPFEEVPTVTSLPETPITPITVMPLPETPGPIEVDTTSPSEAIETDPIPLPDSTGLIDEPIIIPEMPDAGEPITTGDLTDILDTTFTPDASTEEITAVLDGLLDTELTGKQFDAVIDATLGSLDGPDADVGAVLDTFLDADLSDKEFTKVLDAVFSEDVSDEVFTEALTTMLDADLSYAEFDKVLDSAFSETTSPDAMVSALGAIFDGPASGADISRVMDAVFDEDISVADAGAVLGDLLSGDLSGESLTAVFDSVFDGDLSAADTVALVEDIFSEPLSAEEFGTVINAIFDEKVSDEILVGTFSAVLDTPLTEERFAEVVNVLENASITSDQVAQVVDLIVGQEGGVESSQATELATSAKVLESIDAEQAVAVFAAIVVSEVSAESGAAISEALIAAPVEVKESFEEEINVFAGVFDTYEPLGSTINVGQRRSVIAVNLVTSTVALAAAAGAIPTPGSSPSSPSGPRQDVAARREDEEAEEGGAIEGEGPEWIKRISIYKYENGVKVMDWKNFTRKFVYGVMASGFTLAGATVMYFTLSGFTQQIALWGTVLAFTASMYLHMKEPDGE
jgi:hypothetical protein